MCYDIKRNKWKAFLSGREGKGKSHTPFSGAATQNRVATSEVATTLIPAGMLFHIPAGILFIDIIYNVVRV